MFPDIGHTSCGGGLRQTTPGDQMWFMAVSGSRQLHMVILVKGRALVNCKTLQTRFSKQIINVDKCILQVGPGLRRAQFNKGDKGVYWQVIFRWSDRCPRAFCGILRPSCSFLRCSAAFRRCNHPPDPNTELNLDFIHWSFAVLHSCQLRARIKCEVRKCENGQRIKCETESAKWRCENMYKMHKIEKRFVHFFNFFKIFSTERLPYRNNTCIHWISSTLVNAGVVPIR